MLFTIFGVIAVLLQLVSFLPYIRDILIGKTKPEHASFWIFALLIAVTLVAQLSDKVTWASALIATSLLTVLAIAILSLKYGYGTFQKRDAVSIALAIAGIILWQLTSQPILAVLMVILIDFAGFWLILVKTWGAPETETLFAWVVGAVAAGCAIIATQSLDAVQIGYLAYSVIANSLLSILILYRRKVMKVAKFDQ